MFKIYDCFSNCDENKQPYSFSVERHTPTENLHAWVKNDRFYMSSIGNRYILNTPPFETGRFDMNFSLTFLEEINPSFVVIFQYDEKFRKGVGLQFTYDLSGSFEISVVSVEKGAFNVILRGEQQKVALLDENNSYPLHIDIDEKMVSGSVAGAEFRYDLKARCGKLALERHNFVGELVIDDVSFLSDNEFVSENVLPDTTVEIPCVNGGDIPYTISWRVERVQGDCYLEARLAGGTKTRKLNREGRPGQYVAECDLMTNPYIGVRLNNGKRYKFYIFNGKKGFVDPNIYWDCLKGYYNDVSIPAKGLYKISWEDAENISEIVFGYDELKCSGYGGQTGGCEFRFTIDGHIIDYAEPVDGRDIYTVLSNENKLAMTLVPENCYERESVIEHLKYNHYFDVSETPEFILEMKTMKNPEYFSFTAAVTDVFEDEILEKLTCKGEAQEDEFGYNLIKVNVKAPAFKVGLYKIRFSVYFGGKLYKSVAKTFEVFNKDTNENPALVSGLPFVFSMPNEQKWLMRNSFDMWSPARSCEVEHYITCITDTPDEAERRRSWEIAKLFKREWFAWVASRTLPSGRKPEEYTDSLKNADYLFVSFNEREVDLSEGSLYPLRLDKHSYGNFTVRYNDRIKVLEAFMEENPEIAEKIGYTVGCCDFTFEHYVALCKEHLNEWCEYQNQNALELVKKQNEELRKINPNFRRSIYGPLALYYAPTLSYHTVKNNMMTVKHLEDTVYTGFAILEDYPYSCSYQTYRGAFFMMTLLLHCPDVVVYPEQYKECGGGCIDGAVKFAHAPMGEFDMEVYYNTTLTYEYVFNTPYRLPQGFRYWETYGFHRPDFTNEAMNRLVLDWKAVIKNKPLKPLRTMAFLSEFDDAENSFEIRCSNNNSFKTYINNRSEMGEAILFECSRMCGVPNGFAVGFDALGEMKADECDVLVIPSMKNVSAETKTEIRRLYNEGVNLIAVSDVEGLEDIFGVTLNKRDRTINCVLYEGNSEFIREGNAELLYNPMPDSFVCMTSDENDPLIICTERTAVINAEVIAMGADDSTHLGGVTTHFIVGELVRKALSDVVLKLSQPVVQGKNVSVTAFETVDNRIMILAIDYSAFDNRELKEKMVSVEINLNNIKDVVSDAEFFAGRIDGCVKEIMFDIKPHEAKFFELII